MWRLLRAMLLASVSMCDAPAAPGAPAAEAACDGLDGTCDAPPPTPTTTMPKLGPKELMRQRMLASKHRRRGAAAMQAGDAAAAVAALSEAQALTPDDPSLPPLIQRAQVMLNRQEAEAGNDSTEEAEAGDGGSGERSAGKRRENPPNLAEPPPLPPQKVAEPTDGLPEGWAKGSLEGTPFYYPVSDPSRIQWSAPLVPQQPATAAAPPPATAATAAAAAAATPPPPPPSLTARVARQLEEASELVSEGPLPVFYRVDGGGAVAFRHSPEYDATHLLQPGHCVLLKVTACLPGAQMLAV